MRSAFTVMLWLGLCGLTSLGCAGRGKKPLIIPPKEEFHIPPADSPAFSGPVKYPAELLNNVAPPRRKSDEEKYGLPGAGGGGGMGMPGMGRPGP